MASIQECETQQVCTITQSNSSKLDFHPQLRPVKPSTHAWQLGVQACEVAVQAVSCCVQAMGFEKLAHGSSTRAALAINPTTDPTFVTLSASRCTQELQGNKCYRSRNLFVLSGDDGGPRMSHLSTLSMVKVTRGSRALAPPQAEAAGLWCSRQDAQSGTTAHLHHRSQSNMPESGYHD